MKEKQFVLDTETGGLSAKINGLCSIALKVYGKDIKSMIFIKPNKNLQYNPEALKVNGLSLSWLEENGVDEVTAIDMITEFIKNNLEEKPEIIGANIGFDIRFLNALFERNNMGSFENLINHHVNDTSSNMRLLKKSGVTTNDNNRLGTCYTYFTKKEPENAHDAMGDVLMTETVYSEQIKLLESLK